MSAGVSRISQYRSVLKSVSLATLLLLAFGASALRAQPGVVLSHQKISQTMGNFTGVLDDNDEFGISASTFDDLDGDGVPDVAVGVHSDDDAGTNRGAVYILFLNNDGTVKSHQKISSTQGNFPGPLDDDDRFGFAVEVLDDIDGDDVQDLAVGAPHDDDGGTDQGAVYILFMNTDGTVKSSRKLSDNSGNLSVVWTTDSRFGRSLAFLGDLDGNGLNELAVGNPLENDGGTRWGSLYILTLNPDGSVQSAHQKISRTAGGFVASMNDFDLFGHKMTCLGDLNGDGVPDLAVSAQGDDDGGSNCTVSTAHPSCDRGAVHILYLNSNGTVAYNEKISDTFGAFLGDLDDKDNFGDSVSLIGDMNGDGIADLAVGATDDDDGGNDRGAVYILLMNENGTVKQTQKISSIEGNFTGTLFDNDFLGSAVTGLGDLNGDNINDILVGARLDDGIGIDRGSAWVLFLDGEIDCTRPVADANKDCKVDMDDFSLLGTTWLTDCINDPNNLNCFNN
jgi:hypothetical protein